MVNADRAAVVDADEHAGAAPRGRSVSATLRMVTKLPSDFDIFSPPKFTMPEWIQWRANWPSPKAPSDCAISFSWCGKIEVGAAAVDVERLAEVAVGHRRALDVPARPARGPTGSSQDGSPGLAPFHSAKSSGLCFCSPTSMRAPDAQIVDVLLRELAVAGEARHRVVDVAAGGVGEALLLEPLDDLDDLGDVLGGARLVVGRQRRRARACPRSSSSVNSRATSAAERFSASALRMILSSTSVTLRT